MEIIAILLLLGSAYYLHTHENDPLPPRQPRRPVRSPKDYLKEVVISREKKQLEEKIVAENKERIKKNFL